ncbi:MAG TPA: MSHA biogenesis protein MshK [Burkholderiales bacterium]|nr:MSHA biogenesis protein MshK [Burkholderiales bacterium]
MKTTMLLALALFAGSTQAQALSDPMRPPGAALNSGVAKSKGGPVLQTVYIGQDRRYAIIDGERVMQGSAVGDAKVVRIAPNEVTLRDDSGETVLKLYPEVNQLIITPRPPAPAVVPAERGKK